MSDWSLRRVRENCSPCEEGCNCPPARFVHVREVYYDEQGRPWTYADANFLDKLRFIRDWLRTPVLTFPDDFTGEPAWLKELGDLVKL